MRVIITVSTLVLLVPSLAPTQGVDTQIMVRALAHDAKRIGTSVGGAGTPTANVRLHQRQRVVTP